MTRFLPPLVVLALLATPGAAQQAEADAAPRPVKLMTLGTEDTGLTREFYGQVAARQTVDLAFQIGGQLVEFPVLEGRSSARATSWPGSTPNPSSWRSSRPSCARRRPSATSTV
ncbi:hypothetical protein [Limimaricola cinnabarinus]|uniref:hypothetical protein n=1 Tax=Limimaricola cinnabarinus TaxID=1125964 RepID=UPI0003FF1D9E